MSRGIDAATFRLDGRVALVTGSSTGIGLAIARGLAQAGATVVINGRHADRLQQAATLLAADGLPVQQRVFDVTDRAAVDAAVADIESAVGGIDVLVNNAGIARRAAFWELADADWRAVMDTNVGSALAVARAVAPGMMARRSGRIVNLGSVAGLHGRAEGAIYATAKAAVHEYTRCLAVQLRPYNVPVNCIAPGGTLTPRFLATGQAKPGVVDKGGELEGYGRPEDIARAVEYFVTEAGRHVTGQVLRVDGGDQVWPA
jgi:NAD(P)-dependent dehydrogenase (short-subunit alcohol dehydrogenase family)